MARVVGEDFCGSLPILANTPYNPGDDVDRCGLRGFGVHGVPRFIGGVVICGCNEFTANAFQIDPQFIV